MWRRFHERLQPLYQEDYVVGKDPFGLQDATVGVMSYVF